MARIEILVEEPSMKAFLSILLPKILSDNYWTLNQNYFIRSFDGKSDLQNNIPSKIKVFSNWTEPVGVIILQDQDSNDCVKLKNKLIEICETHGNCAKLIRIVCRELESWYIGDFEAVNKAYPNFRFENHASKSKFRNPERCNAYDELKKILPEFQKIDGAKKIAPHINIESNKSESFKQTVSGFLKFFAEIKAKT